MTVSLNITGDLIVMYILWGIKFDFELFHFYKLTKGILINLGVSNIRVEI